MSMGQLWIGNECQKPYSNPTLLHKVTLEPNLRPRGEKPPPDYLS
jgi:hypothetical protein